VSETVVSSTSAVAPSGVSPPIRYILEPDENASESLRPDGRASSVGLTCHGTTAPAGAGQGRFTFVVGHQLTTDRKLYPTSTVLLTVK
jgi:hypothetical protein